jgi:hypothetical protein
MAFAELIGPDGMIYNDCLRVGIFLQGANVHYPSHAHPAQELYYLAQGKSGWAVDDLPLTARSIGEFIFHESMRPHRMQTYSEPMLAIWVWHGELSMTCYKMVSGEQ